jgi:hypothetical protein
MQRGLQGLPGSFELLRGGVKSRGQHSVQHSVLQRFLEEVAINQNSASSARASCLNAYKPRTDRFTIPAGNPVLFAATDDCCLQVLKGLMDVTDAKKCEISVLDMRLAVK